MGRPKKKWWGYMRYIIRGYYTNNVNEDERRAVEDAISQTLAMKNGEDRMKIVEMVLMKHSHSVAGAAMKTHYSEQTAKGYQGDFVRLVAKNFKCNGLS